MGAAHGYTLDIDAQPAKDASYVASYTIGGHDGRVVAKQSLARRFDSYSAALSEAYEAGRAAVAALLRADADAAATLGGLDSVDSDDAGDAAPTPPRPQA